CQFLACTQFLLSLYLCFLFSQLLPPPRSTLFPYTTLFRSETSADIASRLEQALVYHLPDDYFSTYVQKIEAVTAAEVQRVAQKYILPGKFAVVIAGDRKTIEPGIRALNLGEIKIMTVDDVFGPAPTVK